jgi:hypothetical protein
MARRPRTRKKSPVVSSEDGADQVGGAQLLMQPRVLLYQPTVYKTKKKRKKRKYTTGLRDVQRLGRGVSKASYTLTDAVADGFSSFRRSSKKSSRRKRDGALTYFLEDVSKGLGKSARRASRAPYNLAVRINAKPYTRLFGSTVGFFLSPFLR